MSKARNCQIRATLVALLAICPLSSTSRVTVGFMLAFAIAVVSADFMLELSIAPHLNSKLVPAYARAGIASRGIDLDNFTPLTKDEMLARLD